MGRPLPSAHSAWLVLRPDCGFSLLWVSGLALNRWDQMTHKVSSIPGGPVPCKPPLGTTQPGWPGAGRAFHQNSHHDQV